MYLCTEAPSQLDVKLVHLGTVDYSFWIQGVNDPRVDVYCGSIYAIFNIEAISHLSYHNIEFLRSRIYQPPALLHGPCYVRAGNSGELLLKIN